MDKVLDTGRPLCTIRHKQGALVATGFDGLDVSLDGGQSWAHHSDSSHYVARFSPDGRTLWLAGAKRLTRMDWPLQ